MLGSILAASTVVGWKNDGTSKCSLFSIMIESKRRFTLNLATLVLLYVFEGDCLCSNHAIQTMASVVAMAMTGAASPWCRLFWLEKTQDRVVVCGLWSTTVVLSLRTISKEQQKQVSLSQRSVVPSQVTSNPKTRDATYALNAVLCGTVDRSNLNVYVKYLTKK